MTLRDGAGAASASAGRVMATLGAADEHAALDDVVACAHVPAAWLVRTLGDQPA